MIAAALSILLLSQDVSVMSGQSPHAYPRVQNLIARCGELEVEIAGYGHSSDESVASVLINGNILSGIEAEKLRGDLSVRSAVYRFEILCDGNSNITMRINRGEQLRSGAVGYAVGVATISDDRSVSYRGLEVSDEETFWYR